MYMNKSQRGSVTLETSIILPIFLLLFLFIYGLFAIVAAQNQMTHALIQSTKSLSLDSYLTENVESLPEEGLNFWGGLEHMVIDIVRLNNDENFSSRNNWYTSDGGGNQIAKERFVGYLAGGDENKAEEKLKGMGIVDGLEGIAFETKVEGEVLTVTIKYKIQYWFDFLGMGEIPMEQTIKSRLWK